MRRLLHEKRRFIPVLSMFLLLGGAGCSGALDGDSPTSVEREPGSNRDDDESIGGKGDQFSDPSGEDGHYAFEMDFGERVKQEYGDGGHSAKLTLEGALASPIHELLNSEVTEAPPNDVEELLSCSDQQSCTFHDVVNFQRNTHSERYRFTFQSRGGARLLKWLRHNEDVNGIQVETNPQFEPDLSVPEGKTLVRTLHCDFDGTERFATCGLLKRTEGVPGRAVVEKTGGSDFYTEVPEGELELMGYPGAQLGSLLDEARAADDRLESRYVSCSSDTAVCEVDGLDRLTFRWGEEDSETPDVRFSGLRWENGAFGVYDLMYVRKKGGDPLNVRRDVGPIALESNDTRSFGAFRCTAAASSEDRVRDEGSRYSTCRIGLKR